MAAGFPRESALPGDGEAAGTALEAVSPVRIAPSNHWPAREVVHAVSGRGPEPPTWQAYQAACHRSEQPGPPHRGGTGGSASGRTRWAVAPASFPRSSPAAVGGVRG